VLSAGVFLGLADGVVGELAAVAGAGGLAGGDGVVAALGSA
jgi:hypothetical protein